MKFKARARSTVAERMHGDAAAACGHCWHGQGTGHGPVQPAPTPALLAPRNDCWLCLLTPVPAKNPCQGRWQTFMLSRSGHLHALPC